MKILTTQLSPFSCYVLLYRAKYLPQYPVPQYPLITVTLTGNMVTFLGTSAKLRKATTSSVMSGCLSVRMEQLGCYWTGFYET
jgi:hypothetical protein